MRNFLWSGNVEDRKVCTVAWSTLCKPREEGGLSIKDPSTINQASLLFLTWQWLNSTKQWAIICRERFLNKGQPKKHYLTSSIWPGLKQHLHLVLCNSSWSVGNGKSIYFWTDKWLATPIATTWNIPQALFSSLNMRVSDCIIAGNWCLPDYVVTKDPNLSSQIQNILLPSVDMPDKLCWISACDGDLTHSLAYKNLVGNGQKVPWAKMFWNVYIPPSRSFITWRLLHNKLPTDDNLRKRGCPIVSICCFCMQSAESSHHILFACSVTLKLWDWLSKGTNMTLDCTNCLQLLLGRMGTGSALVQHVMNSAIIHTIWAIWIERNQRYFHNTKLAMSTLFNSILAEVHLGYKLSKVAGNSAMLDYKVAKLFNIPLKINRPKPVHDVVWNPPSFGVTKLNCDGSSADTHPCGSIGVVLRSSQATFLGALSSNIGHASPLEAEFCAVMMAIDKAQELQLSQICLETDSLKVVAAYNKGVGIPWQMRTRWHNCKHFCNSITSFCNHIHRKGNLVADALAKNGQSLSLHSTQWWPSPPPFISSLLFRDSFSRPVTRFTMI